MTRLRTVKKYYVYFFFFRADAAVPACAHAWCLKIPNANIGRQVSEPSQEPKLGCTTTLQSGSCAAAGC